MVVAMLALFVALTGTAVATTSALITGKQIKNGSITGLDVRNRSLTPIDFRGSVRGPLGLTGPKGDKGDKGETGAPGVAATKLFAHVTNMGVLTTTQQGAVGSVRDTLGSYTVTFNRDLSGCVAIAQIGNIPTPGGGISVGANGRTSINGATVFVEFRNPSFTLVDTEFNVVAFC
jgi:hypothetical protein